MAHYQHIIQLFTGFLNQDVIQPSNINSYSGDFTLSTQEWQFTLPALHAHLKAHEPEFADIDYSAFRKMIFNSPINSELKKIGAEVRIAENQQAVDKSVYVLGKKAKARKK